MNHVSILKDGNLDLLKELTESVKLDFIKYEDLVAIKSSGYFKRYNPIVLKVRNNSNSVQDLLLITVVRNNSKIGDKNRCTIPLDVQGIKPNSSGKFKLFAFDPFSEKFDGIDIRRTTEQDWSDRSVTDV